MAGLTVTAVAGPYRVGDRWEVIKTVDFDASYPTGGEPITKAQLGFSTTADPEFDVSVRPKNGIVFEYDYTNQKIIAYWVDTTTDGAALAQVPDTTSLATVTGVRVIARGKYLL